MVNVAIGFLLLLEFQAIDSFLFVLFISLNEIEFYICFH